VLRQADAISVREDLEQVGDVACYVIDAKAKTGTYAVWLDPEHGDNIAKAETSLGSNDIYAGRKVKDGDSISISIKNVRFEDIDGVWVPMEIDLHWGCDSSKGISVYSDSHETVTEITIDPDHDKLGSFILDIEDGTPILARYSRTTYWWRNGRIVDSSGSEVDLDSLGPASLTGKALPELAKLNLKLDPKRIENKMILMCFWDMDQRPSRNCLRQLSTRAQELKAQDVSIVAIHASKVDENKLNEWVKKYNIPFPAGAIAADVEKTRFAWGVRSLPWLILADREHVVRAEGFGIEKLDEEIRKIGATPAKQVTPTNNSESLESFLSVEEILAAWESNYAHINTMRVSYKTVLVDWKPPTSDPNEPPPLKYSHVERTEQGIRFHIRCSTAEDGFENPESVKEHTFDGEITTEYWARMKHGSVVSGMIGRSTETKNSLKDYTLLRRRFIGGRNASGTYIMEDPNSEPKLSNTLRYGIEHSSASVRPRLETVAGQLCHVIEIVLPGARDGVAQQIKQVFWIAHDKGMCLMKYRWYWDDELDEEIEVEQIAMTKMNGTAIWYPQKAYRTIFREDSALSKRELTVTEFVPNVEVDENTFQFDFPKGTSVLDRVRGISGVDLPKEPPSLVGQTFPKLLDFNIELNPEHIKGKPILACFWDKDQRPSRNCIMQLAEQARQLKEKGVIVVIVQASKADKNKLSEWVKQHSIPFPAGLVEGDVEKTRFTWGVRSLPWLILTDKRHVVTAEGFSMAELDQNLNGKSNR
jgi:hypothetical protein